MYWFPGWPGPLRADARAVGGVALPAVPLHPGGGVPGGAASPLTGLAAYGVPVGQNSAGLPVLQSGLAPGGLPPVVPGMPGMPAPAEGGGLFQPMMPVVPFDHGNQVRRMQAEGLPQIPPVQVSPDTPVERRNPWEYWCMPQSQA